MPFEQPADWSTIADTLEVPVEFEAPQAAVVYKPGYLRSVPKRAHAVSFRLAMKIVGKESAILSEDTSFQNRVVRWLAWNMPYHAEHHAFPSVPFHKLPALHRHVQAHLKSVSNGYADFTKTYVRHLER